MDKIVAYVRGKPVATAYAKPGGFLINAYGMRFETVFEFYRFALENVYFNESYSANKWTIYICAQ